MTIQEKLQIIQRLSGQSQQELAGRLGVTFAALNRWINNRAVPREKALEKIDELYKELTGQKQIPEGVLDAKKKILLKKSKGHLNIVKEIIENPDIRDRFYLSLTYHSNRIEGSTLSENETAAILFQNAALPNKSLIEQLEAKNHQTALEYLFNHIASGNNVDETLILKLHSILMNGVRPDAGKYRNHAVRIMGANVPAANYLKIPPLMKKLVEDIKAKVNDIVAQISEIHSRFEQIHPFADGNGRVGRLLIHAMTLKANLPPAVILQEKKQLYIAYLNKAQAKGDFSSLEDFVCDAVTAGFNILERKNLGQ